MEGRGCPDRPHLLRPNQPGASHLHRFAQGRPRGPICLRRSRELSKASSPPQTPTTHGSTTPWAAPPSPSPPKTGNRPSDRPEFPTESALGVCKAEGAAIAGIYLRPRGPPDPDRKPGHQATRNQQLTGNLIRNKKISPRDRPEVPNIENPKANIHMLLALQE